MDRFVGRVLVRFAPDSGQGGDFFTDEAERRRALRYSRIQEILEVFGLVWGLVLPAVLVVSGLPPRLRDRLTEVVPKAFPLALAFSAVALLFSTLINLPLSFIRGYIIEHRFGLSNQSLGAWIVDFLKGTGIALLLGTPLIAGLNWIIRRYPHRWWAVVSALTVPFSVLLTNLAPILLMPLFNRFEPIKDKKLEKRIKDLAEGEGVHVSDVMQMDMSRQTKKANAFFTGMGNTKRIVLGDTLLDEFTADEVEVVLAHELGHQVHRDLWKLIALQVPLALVTLYSTQRLAGELQRRFGPRWGLPANDDLGDIAALPLLGVASGASSALLSPLINAAIRRFVEHPADVYALQLTNKTGPFISAMEKLGRMNLANPTPSPLVKWLFHNHPTLQERIQYGREFAARKRR